MKILCMIPLLLICANALASSIYRVPLIHTSILNKFQTWVYYYHAGHYQAILSHIDSGSGTIVAEADRAICPQCQSHNLLTVSPNLLGKTFANHYGSGAADLRVYPATLSLYGTPKIKANIGVVTTIMRGNMHPILGLNPQEKTGEQIKSFMANFVRAENMPYDFSLLLCPHGGELDLGGAVPALTANKLPISIPFAKKLNRFTVVPDVLSVTVNHQTKQLGRFPAFSRHNHYVLDSGTPTWVVARPLYRDIANTLIAFSRREQLNIPARFWRGHDGYHGYYLPAGVVAQFKTFPVFNIQFQNGSILQVKAATYLRKLASGNYFFAIRPADKKGNNIFGDTVLMGYYVNYNWQAGMASFYSNQGLCGSDKVVRFRG